MNAVNDMREVIIPKSDQINADNLLSGPITITIREVSIRPGTEQPVSIHFDGDGGKPWKPCKSMSRVLVHAWGSDAKAYVGRSLSLYCDPKVKWGGMQVGGIRISHMSHIDRDMLMALTETKGKRAPFLVKPLSKSQPPAGDAAQPPAPSTTQPGASEPATFAEDVVNGDGEVHTFDSLKDYITGLRLAVSGAVDKATIWSDNGKVFASVLERARENKRPKSVAALEALEKEVNEMLSK